MSNNRTSLVSSLSLAMKKAIAPPTDVEEVKQAHRETIYTLIEDYKTRVAQGSAEGIRNARELVELIKTDLLLIGEATDRTDQMNPIDDAKISRMTGVLNEKDEQVQVLLQSLFQTLNNTNDDFDPSKKTEGVSFDMSIDLSTSPQTQDTIIQDIEAEETNNPLEEDKIEEDKSVE